VELGFLEFVPNESIEVAVERLESQGIRDIIAVPLFVSSYSSHIQEIEYVLRLRDSLSSGDDLARVNTTANITMTRALDDHSLLAYILADRIAEVCQEPANETVVILSHGTDNEEDIRSQVCCQSWLAEEVKSYLRYWASPSIKLRDVKYAFIHGNQTLYPDLTVESVMRNASKAGGSSEDGNGSVIVLPLMVAGGSITDSQIPKILEGYGCRYDRATLASHPNLARWIENRVRCEIGEGMGGVLIIDHGSSDPKRAEAVRELAGQVNLMFPSMPVAVAFAENAAEEETIPGGIGKLLDQGASRIFAVTLFTGNTIDHEEAREAVYSALNNINHTRVLMTSPIHSGIVAEVVGPIDDHPMIADLILDRAREVSRDEINETLILAPWGSSTYFEESEIQARSLAERIKSGSKFKDVRFGFMEYQGSQNIREAVKKAHGESVIVVTVNSMGTRYVDDLIAERLEGLNYTYNGKGFYGYSENLDPHPNIARWIEYKVAEEVRA
jgi:sirohydrochlorin ferrochelatase